MKPKKKKQVHIAVLVVWAAVIAASSLLPSLPIFGTGGTFSISSALVPLCGVFFGPLGGALSATIGGIIGQIIAPQTAWMGMATFVLSTATALVAGLLMTGKLRNLIICWVLFIGGSIMWYFSPIGREAWLLPLVTYGSGALVSLLAFALMKRKALSGHNVWLKTIVMWSVCFAGIQAGVVVGNNVALLLYGLPAEVWRVITWLGPAERALFAVVATIVGLPLLVALPKIGIYIGPDADESASENELEIPVN